MKLNKFIPLISITLGLVSFVITSMSYAATTDQDINLLLQSTPTSNLTARIIIISQAFLNKPYQNEPLGEGVQSEFNQNPLYRLDRFDCETYVDTVLALALSKNVQQFKVWINEIRYADGQPSFISRNHFTDADWLVNNQRKGLVKNISADVAGKSQVKLAQATINKKAWYQQLSLERIQIANLNAEQRQTKLQQLHQLADQVSNTTALLSYIPLEQLFIDGDNRQGKTPNLAFLNRIPTGSIILIVRPNWPIKHLIGTNMNVSHMGLVIKHNGQTFIRAASSSVQHAVVDLPLIPYLRGYLYDSTVKGISLLAATDPHHAH